MQHPRALVAGAKAKEGYYAGPTTGRARYKRQMDAIQEREVLYRHLRLPCTDLGKRDPSTNDPRKTLTSEVAVRICAMARKQHEQGDAFSVEYQEPSAMPEMECWRELLKLPGIFTPSRSSFAPFFSLFRQRSERWSRCS